MQWKIFILLLGYVAANERYERQTGFNPNHDTQYKKILEERRSTQLTDQKCRYRTRCVYYGEFGDVFTSPDCLNLMQVRVSNFETITPRLCSVQAVVREYEERRPAQKNTSLRPVHAPEQSTNANTQGGNGATGGNAGANGATDRRTDAELHREINAGGNRRNKGACSAASDSAPIPQGNTPMYKFHQKLFKVLAPINYQRNLIYSPMSLNTLLAMVYIGANDRTAAELKSTMELPEDRNACAQDFERIFNTECIKGDAQLLMANKMYHNKAMIPLPVANNYAQRYFKAEVKPIDFAKRSAANEINNWVADKTENHIQNLITPNSLNERTSAILINAIYFKAKWAKEFSTSDTQTGNFYAASDQIMPVDMMYTDDIFKYAQLDDIQAVALNLPYKDTDLSMLIVLPNDKNGLRAVEEQFSYMDLSDVVARMKMESVTVRLPKFSIESEEDMVQPLTNTGIHDLFTSHANLTGFFEGPDQPMVSKVQHKAFINVNEAGSEAAAASFAKFIPLSLPAKPRHFTADHPFMFIIYSPQAVYFAGHVVNV